MRLLKGLVVGALLLWALLALLVRAATPLIADSRADIAAALSDRLGVPVRIGTLQARWYGFSPLLEMGHVRLGTAPEALEIRRVVLSPRLAALAGAPLLQGMTMTIDGLRLTVVRESDGRVHLQGFGHVAGGAGDAAAAPPLPRQVRLVDTQVTWIDRMLDRPPVELHDVYGSLDNAGGRLSIRAGLETVSGKAQLAAEIDGAPTGTDWRGETHLRVDDLDVATALGAYLPDAYELQSLQLDLESWTRWEAARPVHAHGRFAMRDLHLAGTGGGALEVRHLEARFTGQQGGDGLLLGLHDLDVRFPGGDWPVGEVALALRGTPGAGPRVDLAASYLRLEDLERVLQVRLPTAGLASPLQGLAPRGELHDLRLQLTHAEGGVEWRLATDFADLSTDPWGEVPGVRGISGRLSGRPGHLVLELESRDATLRPDRMFRNAIPLRKLQGRVDLTFDGDAWQARSDLLVVDTPHIATRTRLFLDQQPGQSLFVDLQSDFRDGDAAFAGLYYPVSKMSAKLVRWLDRSILSGRIVSGSALVYGPVSDYAFEKTRSGSFQAIFETDDVALDYKAGWPPIRDLDARVRFEGNHLDIMSRAATIYDSRVVDVHAHIAALEPDAAPLQVRGRLDGPLRNVFKVLQEDALAPRFGAIARTLEGRGGSELLLDFQVPLEDVGEDALEGELRLDGNGLRIAQYGLDIEDVVGRIGFTLDGLRADGIRANALGAPVSVDVTPLAGGTTRVRTRGEVDYAALSAQFGFLPPGLAAGRSDYLVEVDVPPRGAISDATRLRVRSDLVGTELRLPAPFGKPADQAGALDLSLPLDRTAADDGVLTYADLVAARFTGDGERVAVAFAARPPDLPRQPGIVVGGRLQRVDVAALQAAVAGLGTGAGADDGRPVTIDLDVDRLIYDAFALDDLSVEAQRRDGSWTGSVNASQLAGTFTLPGTPARAPVSVDLDRLHLAPADDGARGVDPGAKTRAAPDPRALPGLRLDVRDLRINDADLGRLRLQALPVADGLSIDVLRLTGGQVGLDGSGEWSIDDGVSETRLQGTAVSDDIGALVAGLGYTPQVEDTAGELTWRLAWSGHPAQPRTETLTGELRAEIGAGRLTEIEPGVGRIVGLLNLNALTRRLRLDFTDLFDKGFAFDSIRGDFGVEAGRATTENLAIEGPTGRLLLKGTTDLPTRTLDQHVTVYPDATATLPIAGTLAGGPVAGLAVLVAQEVMAKQVDDINRFEYRVTGPWDQPEVEQLDSGGALSKLVAPIGEISRRLGGPAQPPDTGPNPAPASAAAAGPEWTPIAAPRVDAAGTTATPPGGAGADDGPDEPTDPVGRTLRGIVDLLREQRDGPDAGPELNP